MNSEAKTWPAFVGKHGAIILLLLFFGALYSTTLHAYGMLVWDEAEYASLGRSVVRGEGFTFSGKPNSFRLPLVPLSAAASMLLLHSTEDVIVRLPGLFFSLLALFVVYWCTMTQFDRTTGLVAAALLGLFPSFWCSTPRLLTEIPFMAFFTAAVLFFSFGLYRARQFFYWSWLCFGLALATRYNAVLFAPIIITFLVLAVLLRDTEVRDKLWSKDFFIGPFLGLALVIPWLLRQQLTAGSFLSGFQGAQAQVQVLHRGKMPWYFYPVQVPEMISWIPTVLLLCGIFWALRRRERFALHCLLAGLTIVVWFSGYGYKGTRLVTSILPFLAILAAVGLTKQLLPARVGSPFFYGMLAVCLSVVFVLNFRDTRRTLTSVVARGYPSFLRAMQFLREQASPDAVLLGANYPQIYWYTDRRVMPLPRDGRLKTALERTEWVILTNFERTRRASVGKLRQLFTGQDIREGRVLPFRDKHYWTILVRSDLLRQRLEEKEKSNEPRAPGEPGSAVPPSP
jgi:4-amino-4-deoxy-L-arabinose transferase-like glycosyltransferase